MANDEEVKSHLNTVLKAVRFSGPGALKKCVFPQPEPCGNPAINAHFVSRNLMSKTIAESGKVIVFKSKIIGKNDIGTPIPSIEPTEVDISAAAQFSGLCWEHDQIFQCVDNKIPQKRGNKELFYMAFRQVLRNVWSEENKYHSIEKFKKELPPDMLKPMRGNMDYLDMRQYAGDSQLVNYENIRKSRSWGKLRHMILVFPLKQQGIILSTGMTMMENPHNLLDNAINLKINIYPLIEKEKLLVVLSMLESEYNLFKQDFSKLIHGTLEEKQQLISKFLLTNGDGLLFRPSYWSSLPESKTIPLLNFFRGNMHPEAYSLKLPPISMNWDFNFFA